MLVFQFPLGTKCGTVANQASVTMGTIAHRPLDSIFFFSLTLRIERQEYSFFCVHNSLLPDLWKCLSLQI